MSVTVGSLHRAQQAYCQQLGESRALEAGVAFTSELHPAVGDANQFREVVIASSEDIPGAYEEATAYFAERGCVCSRWTPALDQPVDALGRYLEGLGFHREDFAAFVLRESVAMPTPDDVRILPARAMRKALHVVLSDAYADEVAGDDACAMAVEAAKDRLDDPHLEGFVAMRGDVPAGYVALHQVGDIGRLQGLFVCPEHREAGVGTALMGKALRMGRRLAIRVLCAGVPTSKVAGTSLMGKCGMMVDGGWAEFVAPVG